MESVLDVSHQQMEQYRDQPAHAEKIAYQQKLLQEDVVHIRAEISQVSTVTSVMPIYERDRFFDSLVNVEIGSVAPSV